MACLYLRVRVVETFHETSLLLVVIMQKNGLWVELDMVLSW